jgi:hypothetical protein
MGYYKKIVTARLEVNNYDEFEDYMAHLEQTTKDEKSNYYSVRRMQEFLDRWKQESMFWKKPK